MAGPTLSGVAGGSSSGVGGGSASGGAAKLGAYVRVRQLPSGGTFTGGISLDWYPQFDTASDAITSASPTLAGEVVVEASTLGVCADYAFEAVNPFDAVVWLELPSSGRIQVQLNGTSTEYVAAQSVTLSFVAGLNVLRLITASGAILMRGRCWGSDGNSAWISLYPVDADPLLMSSSSSAGATAADTAVS